LRLNRKAHEDREADPADLERCSSIAEHACLHLPGVFACLCVARRQTTQTGATCLRAARKQAHRQAAQRTQLGFGGLQDHSAEDGSDPSVLGFPGLS
jgi:hypothetical protein